MSARRQMARADRIRVSTEISDILGNGVNRNLNVDLVSVKPRDRGTGAIRKRPPPGLTGK